MKYVFDLHQAMISENLILVYEGEFTQEITKSILSMVERNMDSVGEDSAIKRKVFNVMVECLQNIVKHSESEGNAGKDHTAIFMIGKNENEYIITSGNPVNQEDKEKITEKLEYINKQDRDGLKALYKEIIKTGSISEKGGAGLGFVDMARKSGEKLIFDFKDIEENLFFFSLQALISRV